MQNAGLDVSFGHSALQDRQHRLRCLRRRTASDGYPRGGELSETAPAAGVRHGPRREAVRVQPLAAAW